MKKRNSYKVIIEEIKRLKREKNAIILAHNYVLGEVQDVADFVGDSLELSIKAKEIKEDVIVFCGVKFMAETAKILSPDKTVLHPVERSGCPMADMVDVDDLCSFKQKYPNAIVVAYVNTTAEVKAHVDICCTSSNAEAIVAEIPEDREIIFLPDSNLGKNVMHKTGRNMILWDGFCPTHMRLTQEALLKKKAEFPDAVVVAHPECQPAVVEVADHSLSTGGILKLCKESGHKQFIIVTEMGIIHRLSKENPEKQFIPVSEQAVCMNMKMIELSDVLNSLKKMETEIILDKDIIEKASVSIERMLERKMDF